MIIVADTSTSFAGFDADQAELPQANLDGFGRKTHVVRACS
jgi:hypothetical protein